MPIDTPQDRAALLAVCDAATEGPWGVNRYDNYIGWSIYARDRGCIAERWYDARQKPPYSDELAVNAVFIVAARTELPAALRRLDALEAALASLATAYRVAVRVPTGMTDELGHPMDPRLLYAEDILLGKARAALAASKGGG